MFSECVLTTCKCRSVSPHCSDSFRSGLMFYCKCLFIFLSTRDLQDALADQCEILHGDQT